MSPRPYDWEEGRSDERELERFRRTGHGNGSPLSRGEFYAVHESHLVEDEKRDARIQALEEKVYAPERWLRAMFWTGWGKLVLVMFALVLALAVSQLHEWFDWHIPLP